MLRVFISLKPNSTDASGNQLDEDGDEIYKEILVTETTSSTTGDIFATNLSVGSDYTINWMTINYVTFENLIINNSMTVGQAVNASKIDEGYDNYSATANSETIKFHGIAQPRWMNTVFLLLFTLKMRL